MIENKKSDLREIKEIVKSNAKTIDKISLKLEAVYEQVGKNDKDINRNAEMIAKNAEGINTTFLLAKMIQTDLTHLINEYQFSTQEQINEIEDKGVGDNKAYIDYMSKRLDALEKTFIKHGMEVEALDIAID